jgi:hypothetical protein
MEQLTHGPSALGIGVIRSRSLAKHNEFERLLDGCCRRVGSQVRFHALKPGSELLVGRRRSSSYTAAIRPL